MRISWPKFFLLPVFTPLLANAAEAQLPGNTPGRNCVGKANKAKVSAYVVLLRLRWDIYAKWKETGVWPDDAEANKAIEGHSGYWTQQLKQGHAIFAGAMNGEYWDNAAMIVFEAASQQEAEAVVKKDPAVQAHVFQAQVRPFDMFWLTNKFSPDAAVCTESGSQPSTEKAPAKP